MHSRHLDHLLDEHLTNGLIVLLHLHSRHSDEHHSDEQSDEHLDDDGRHLLPLLMHSHHLHLDEGWLLRNDLNDGLLLLLLNQLLMHRHHHELLNDGDPLLDDDDNVLLMSMHMGGYDYLYVLLGDFVDHLERYYGQLFFEYEYLQTVMGSS